MWIAKNCVLPERLTPRVRPCAGAFLSCWYTIVFTGWPVMVYPHTYMPLSSGVSSSRVARKICDSGGSSNTLIRNSAPSTRTNTQESSSGIFSPRQTLARSMRGVSVESDILAR